MSNNPELIQESRYGNYWINQKGVELEKAAYEELLTSGKVKYIEITPVPEWTN